MDDGTRVLEADAERYRAMREGDLQALEQLLADDLADGRWRMAAWASSPIPAPH